MGLHRLPMCVASDVASCSLRSHSAAVASCAGSFVGATAARSSRRVSQRAASQRRSARLAVVLIAPAPESPLSLDDVQLGPGETKAFAEDDHDSLLYVQHGSGLLTLAGGSHRLEPRSAALVLAAEGATVTGDGVGISFVHGRVGASADRHAPLGEREVVAQLDGAQASVATGARSFEILFGPGNG